MRRLILLLLLAVLTVIVCSAQATPPVPIQGNGPTAPDPIGTVVGGWGADLVINLVLPNNSPAGQNISVVLESSRGGIIAQSVTNSKGQATFRGVYPGRYLVHVTGGNVKGVVSEEIDMQPDDKHHIESIQVSFPDLKQQQTVSSNQGSVSAASLNIPDKARKEVDKGNDALDDGDTSKAKEHYLKAIEIYPKYAVAYNNLGALYMRATDKQHAREAWTKALEIDPTLDGANLNLARLDFLDKDYRGAVTLLEKALVARAKDPEALLLMAEAQLNIGDYDKALVYAHKVYEVEHHRYEMAHIIAGRALEAEEHPDQARVEYQNLLREAPSAPEATEARDSLYRLRAAQQ